MSATETTTADLLARLERLRARLVDEGRDEAVSALDAAIADARDGLPGQRRPRQSRGGRRHRAFGA